MNIIEKTVEVKYFNKYGVRTGNEEEAIAKEIIGEITQYFLLTYGNILYDRDNVEPGYSKKPWKMCRVSHDKYESYMRYMLTGRRIHLIRAERI